MVNKYYKNEVNHKHKKYQQKYSKTKRFKIHLVKA